MSVFQNSACRTLIPLYIHMGVTEQWGWEDVETTSHKSPPEIVLRPNFVWVQTLPEASKTIERIENYREEAEELEGWEKPCGSAQSTQGTTDTEGACQQQSGNRIKNSTARRC